MVPDDPERRAVTGGLSLSYAVVPDEPVSYTHLTLPTN